MKALRNICILFLTLLVSCRSEESQPQDFHTKQKVFLVTDSSFQKKMFEYLIKRVTDQYFDSAGRQLSVEDEYRDTPILLIDLKIPTIVKDTLAVGVYKVLFGCEDCGAPPELLINTGSDWGFFDLDKGGLTTDHVIDSVQKLLASQPNRFNDSDQAVIKRNVMRLVLQDRLQY